MDIHQSIQRQPTCEWTSEPQGTPDPQGLADSRDGLCQDPVAISKDSPKEDPHEHDLHQGQTHQRLQKPSMNDTDQQGLHVPHTVYVVPN